MKLVKKENIFVLICSYDERMTAKDAGMRWDAAGRRWYSADVKVAKKLSAYADAETLAALDATEKKVAEKIQESAATDADINIPAPEGLRYMPFQKAGIAFALNRKSVLFGDEMGLGKGIQSIGIINSLPEAKQILIICPASLKLNWQRECEKWLVSQRKIELLNGKESKKESDIYIINYDILSKHPWLAEREWDIVICDEIHMAKSPKALRTKACFAILKKAKRKICLTGTPIMNRPIELQGILTQLGCDFASNWFSYAKRYCAGEKNRFGWDVSGASNLDELQEKLRSTVMIRRLKKDVLADLPAKTRQVIEIPKTGFSSALKKEEKIMKSVEEKRRMLEDLKAQSEAQKDDAGFRAKIDALRETLKVDFAEISVIRHETALAKVDYTIDYLTEMLESNDKIILFAHHLDVLEKIYQAFPGIAVKFTGEMNGEQKQAAVDRFQTDAGCKVFIASTMAAGVGITLTAAKLVIFHELEWTPSSISQAEDRCHRYGQKENVLIQHLVIDGSIDAMLAKKILAKQEIIEKALDKTGLDEEVEL